MKIIILILAMFLTGCLQSTQEKQLSEKQTYPVSIEGEKKRVEERGRNGINSSEVYPDTITLSKGEIYRNERDSGLLTPFYLSYKEWETIRCIISMDERSYWDKAMIGLIQKSGTLRIRSKNQDIFLKPLKTKSINEGIWTNTYSNDSIEITISSKFENKRILRRLTGFGSIQGRIGKAHFSENAFFVYSKD